MSLNRREKTLHLSRLFLSAGLITAVASTGYAQYPGKVSEPQKDAPALRSVAVLEWTGDAEKPKASRLIPVTVFNEGDYQDGGLYMARPAPLALTYDTQYELEESGIPKGYFNVTQAGRLAESWFGYGTWQPLKSPTPPKGGQSRLTPEVVVDADDDKPHLKRHAGSEAPEDAGKPGAGTSSSPGSQKSSSPDQKNSSKASPPSAPEDPDRPHLRKRPKDAGTPASEVGVEAMAPDSGSDPNRPKLHRGQPQTPQTFVADKLTGIPEDLHQMVAVSDASDRPQHSFVYTWANPEEEATARAALEQIAWKDLAPASPPPPKAKVSSTTRRRTTAVPATAAPKPHFEDEQFKAFELAYGSGATMVFSARTEGEGSDQHFITLLAETDLYGTPHILLKRTTDGGHLDQTPQMRLIDAVDADGNNRGELLFEMRGQKERQFVLYRITRGRAEQIFATATLP